MDEDFADAVTMLKALLAALYGLEAGWLNDNSLKQLDEISGFCDYRAHLLPFSSNKECRAFRHPISQHLTSWLPNKPTCTLNSYRSRIPFGRLYLPQLLILH